MVKALGGSLDEFPDYQPAVEPASVAVTDDDVRAGAMALARAMGAQGALAIRRVPAAGGSGEA